MLTSQTVNRLMFDWEELGQDGVREFAKGLSLKILRWLSENHPDNTTRKIFFELSGIRVPESTVINKYCVVSDDYEELLQLGERVAVSPNVTFICASSPNNSKLNENQHLYPDVITSNYIVIGDDCWIGANVVILPGVTIGSGTIIGAGSVVNKNLKSNAIYAGVPAKLIKEL